MFNTPDFLTQFILFIKYINTSYLIKKCRFKIYYYYICRND